MKDDKKLLDYIYISLNGLKDDTKELLSDFKKYMKRKNKNKNINRNNSTKKRYKINMLKVMYFIIGLAFVGALIITIKTNLFNFISINPNKVKSIKIYNYIQDDGAKVMTVDEHDGIEKIVDALNSIKKEEIEKVDDIFTEDDSIASNDKLTTIITIEYKKKIDVINIYNNVIKYKKKTITFNNNIDSLWYKLNYNIKSCDINEFENYIIK